jgi:hypothetical protein
MRSMSSTENDTSSACAPSLSVVSYTVILRIQII